MLFFPPFAFPMQIVPSSSHAADAVNFRSLKESKSLHLETQQSHVKGAGGPTTPGVDDVADDVDLFGGFSSITLYHDGES